MRLQREQLCEDIRQDILQDDITKKLVQYKDEDMSDIFAIELRKHDAKKKLLEQNMYAQANILEALTESNAMYADTRRVISDLLSARRELISSLVTSFYAFDDLLVKAAKGLEFYAKLDSNVSKLLNRVKVKKKINSQIKRKNK
jgi:tyrosine-protein phosphatase non-receptor type 23